MSSTARLACAGETCGIPITQLADAEKVAFRRRAAGFVFQQHNLLPALTAAELRMPAIIEVRVVLPQPDGPTSMVSSPAGTSKLIPWSTSTSPPPQETIW
jgi:hypothetical protein